MSDALGGETWFSRHKGFGAYFLMGIYTSKFGLELYGLCAWK